MLLKLGEALKTSVGGLVPPCENLLCEGVMSQLFEGSRSRKGGLFLRY